MKAVFDQEYVKRINGPNVKQGRNHMEKAQALIEDIETFRKDNNCARLVMVWCGSTEVFHKPAAIHQRSNRLRRPFARTTPTSRPARSMRTPLWKCGVPFANGAPNLTTDIPALLDLARDRNVPLCAKTSRPVKRS